MVGSCRVAARDSTISSGRHADVFAIGASESADRLESRTVLGLIKPSTLPGYDRQIGVSMNVRRFLYAGATVAAGALCATVAAAALKYTMSYSDSSSMIFSGSDGTKTAVSLGSGQCSGSVSGKTLTQSGCDFSPSTSPTSIGGVEVFTSFSSCSGSGTVSASASGSTVSMSQSFALRVSAADGTFDCSTPCSMKVATKGDLDTTGNGHLSLASPASGPVFDVSPMCSPEVKAALEGSLSTLVGADFGVSLSSF